jgi:hypothetical protein
VQGRSLERATVNDLYMALAHTVRDRLVERWTSTVQNYHAQDARMIFRSIPCSTQGRPDRENRLRPHNRKLPRIAGAVDSPSWLAGHSGISNSEL